MTHCTGPCDQGRLPCPCPAACQFEDEPPEPSSYRVVFVDAMIAVVIIAAIAAIVLGVAG